MKMYNMTAADVSIATGLTEGSVYTARHQGKLMAKQAHNGRIFFAEEDVKLWRDNTNVWQYDPEALPCGGYNNYRTLKIKQGIHQHVNMGHWTDFDFCIKWEAYKDIDEGVSKKSLHDTMVEKAETLIDALETIDKNRLPNNNVLKS